MGWYWASYSSGLCIPSELCDFGSAAVLRAGKINELGGSMAPIRPADADVAFKDGRHWVTVSYSTTVTGDVVYGHRLNGGQTLIVVTVTDNTGLRPV